MKIKTIAKIQSGQQDGAIFGDLMFRFHAKGLGRVYDMKAITRGNPDEEIEPIATFTLDRAEEICPHSNAVMFGNEYFEEGDEFPLLYSNIYNNYAKTDRPLKGVCCVYRLQRDGDSFKTNLVQLIEIGFVENADLWKRTPTEDGIRPYGNFVIDTERNLYHGFVMRDEEAGTRYFTFDLPRLCDGEIDETFGVRKVTLRPEDIHKHFDCPAHYYIQGACCHGGKIYSVEGFKNTPAIRVIDPDAARQEMTVFFPDHGLVDEAEFIDFYGDVCYYSDCRGYIYQLEF